MTLVTSGPGGHRALFVVAAEQWCALFCCLPSSPRRTVAQQYEERSYANQNLLAACSALEMQRRPRKRPPRHRCLSVLVCTVEQQMIRSPEALISMECVLSNGNGAAHLGDAVRLWIAIVARNDPKVGHANARNQSMWTTQGRGDLCCM